MDHNTTKSLNRHILSFSASLLDTSVLETKTEGEETKEEGNGGEGPWGRILKFEIHGQSFLYNQIRKMIGCVIQVFQEKLSMEFIENSFRPNMFEVWLAPAEGLLLADVPH